MKKRYHEKVNMYAAVLRQFETDPSILEFIPVIEELLEPLKANFVFIRSIAQKQHVDLGAATDYPKLKAQTAGDVLDLANTVFAWASHHGDSLLKKQFEYNLSELQALRNPAFGDTCMEIINYTRPFVNQLARFGVTTGSLNALEKKVRVYIEALPKRRNLRVIGSQKLLELYAKFSEADIILREQVDKMMLRFKKQDKSVYDRYIANRKLVKLPVTVTQVRGFISSDSSPKGLKGVAITLVETGDVRYSNGKGSFRFLQLAAGACTLSFTASGYEPQFAKDILVRSGQVTRCSVVLEKTLALE